MNKFGDLAKAAASNIRDLNDMLGMASTVISDEETVNQMTVILEKLLNKPNTTPWSFTQDDHLFSDPEFLAEVDNTILRAQEKFRGKGQAQQAQENAFATEVQDDPQPQCEEIVQNSQLVVYRADPIEQYNPCPAFDSEDTPSPHIISSPVHHDEEPILTDEQDPTEIVRDVLLNMEEYTRDDETGDVSEAQTSSSEDQNEGPIQRQRLARFQLCCMKTCGNEYINNIHTTLCCRRSTREWRSVPVGLRSPFMTNSAIDFNKITARKRRLAEYAMADLDGE